MLTVTERIVLIAFDHPKRVLTEATDLTLGYALSGALLVDLALRGYLDVEDQSAIRIDKNTSPKENFLSKAKAIIEAMDGSDKVTVFKELYTLNYHIKPLILDTLVEKGFLGVKSTRLKWSFDVRRYSLKKTHQGFRSQLFESMTHDQMTVNDFCVAQLAAATSLLRDTADEKQLHKMKKRLNTLSRLMTMTQTITEMMDSVLPDSIAKSHKLGPMQGKRSYPATWEWRGFWREKEGPSLLQASNRYQKNKDTVAFSEMTDTYLIIENNDDNIKIRDTGLEVKRPIESHHGFTAYYPKQVYPFPFAAQALADIFPRLFGVEGKVESLDALLRVLEDKDYAPHTVSLKKKRMQFALEKQVKLEFATLEAGGERYLSACVEGPDYDVIHAHVQNLAGSKARVCNYYQFIRESLGNGAPKPKKKKASS